MNPKMTLEEAVWVDPERMSGVPCFRGSRLPVKQLFDWLADGVPLDEFIKDFQIDRRAAEVILRVAGTEFSELCAKRSVQRKLHLYRWEGNESSPSTVSRAEEPFGEGTDTCPT